MIVWASGSVDKWFPFIYFSTLKTEAAGSVQNVDPSIHLWRQSPFWALASLRRCLHSSPSSPRLLHPRFPRICDVSLRMTSSHLVLGFASGHVLWNFPLMNIFGILSCSILVMWPTRSVDILPVNRSMRRHNPEFRNIYVHYREDL